MKTSVFVRRYLAPFAGWYAAGTLALLATNAMSVTIPLYVASGIDGLAQSRPEEALHSALWVGVMGLAVIGVRTLSRVWFFTPGRWVEQRLKADLFAAILRHQPSFLNQYETGDLFSRISSDVNQLRLLAGFGILQVANTVFALGFAAVQMGRIAGDLVLWLIGPLAVALVLVQISIRQLFELMRRLQREQASLSGSVLATWRGVATVHAAGAETAFLRRFDTHNEQVLDTSLAQARLRATMGPILSFAADLNIVIVLAVGGPRVIEGTMTVGELVALITLVGFVTGPLRASSFLVSIVRNGQAALERVGVLLETPPDRPDLPSPSPAPSEPPSLELRHLTYRHAGAQHDALSDVSFRVPAGSTVGIFGATGSGKSTLLSILARLHNPPPGTVFVNGEDLTRVDLDAWRAACILVPQRAFLFSETLADNILLGVDDPATLQRVLELADLDRDVAALPERELTVVGEAGVRLSGGQRQRAALARALARRGHVLMLDDVLSAVDHATEHRLLATLRDAARGGGTTLLVAHRVSALMLADLVVVLDEGRVVACGRPSELLEQPGPFQAAWQTQQRDPGEASA